MSGPEVDKSFSLHEIYQSLVDRGFFSPRREQREFIAEALEHVEKAVAEGRVALVRAPPGCGKTAISVVASVYSLLNPGAGRFLQTIHVVPTRSLVEDIYLRVREGFRRLGIDSDSLVSRQYGLAHEAPFLAGVFTVSTLDTYFYNLVKIPLAEVGKVASGASLGHYEIPRSSIFSSLNFLDEAHMFLEELGGAGASRAASTFVSLVRSLALSGTPTVLSTATLPDLAVDYLSSVVPTRVIDYGVRKEDAFFQREASKEFYTIELEGARGGVAEVESHEALASKLIERLHDGDSEVGGRAVAVLVNTVRSARSIFRALRNRGIDAVLLHSRFTPKDREEKLSHVRGHPRTVLVSTQVIEVGVDLSFDAVISELAAPSSMVQRFGRLARGEKGEGWWLVYYTRDTIEEGSGVYDSNLVAKAREYLVDVKGRIHWHLPKVESGGVGYLDFINGCWSEYNPGRELDVETVVLSPLINSRQVLKFLERVSGLLRDENLCVVYLAEDRDDVVGDLWSLLERQHTSTVTMRCCAVARALDKALERGCEAKVLCRKSPGKSELRCRCASKSDVGVLEKLGRMFLSDIVAVVLPREEFYEGGVYGEGFKEP